MGMRKNIPQIYLEQIYLNELPSSRIETVNNQSIGILIEPIKQSNREILDTYPPAEMTEILLRKMNAENREDKKTPVFRSSILKFTPIAAALIILTLNLAYLGKNSQQDNIIRAKGLTPELSVYMDNGKNPVELSTNDTVSESDIIQLTYNAAGNRYGMIFSIDGRGIITLHYPVNKNSEPGLDPNGSHALPFSYELDDAPDFERFFFVSSNKKFNIGTVLESAENTIAQGSASTAKYLNLSSDFDQNSILLKKGY
jgi:hypothetical protein